MIWLIMLLKIPDDVNNETVIKLQDLFDTMLEKIYPIGSIYLSVKSTNPEFFIGGKWILFGNGRAIVGIDPNKAEFGVSEQVGGNPNVFSSFTDEHILTSMQIPDHMHVIGCYEGGVDTDSSDERYIDNEVTGNYRESLGNNGYPHIVMKGAGSASPGNYLPGGGGIATN